MSSKKFPFYLGYSKYAKTEDSIMYVYVYKSKPKIVTRHDVECEVLDFKMKISKDDLLFVETERGTEVWSKIDQGEHFKNETSVICDSETDSMFGGNSWRGMILKED